MFKVVSQYFFPTKLRSASICFVNLIIISLINVFYDCQSLIYSINFKKRSTKNVKLV